MRRSWISGSTFLLTATLSGAYCEYDGKRYAAGQKFTTDAGSIYQCLRGALSKVGQFRFSSFTSFFRSVQIDLTSLHEGDLGARVCL